MVEFENRGFHGVRVDDVVRRAGISHGTFYLYFSNKEDLFKALLKDALHDMEIVAGDFPVVTSDETGLSVLRQWVRKFFRAYAAHATVIRILSQADLVPEEVFGDGLQLFFSIAESMTTGMTAAAEAAGRHQERAELTAVACLMMLERVNYLISAEVQLPADEMADRIADIIFAAFGLNACVSGPGQIMGPAPQIGDGSEGFAGARADVVHAEDAGAEPGADRQGGDRALGALADRQGEGLADEVLVRDRDQDRPAGAGQLAQAPGDLERLPGVLAEVVRGIDQDGARATPTPRPVRHNPVT